MKIGFVVLASLFVMYTTVSAQTAPQVIHLWQNGAPGFENRKDEPEQAQDYWVKNVNNPSVTVFLPPKAKATGTAVIIAPGGGFSELVFDAEGKQPAEYLNSIGVAAFALKYRLPGEPNSPYTAENVLTARCGWCAAEQRNGTSTHTGWECLVFPREAR